MFLFRDIKDELDDQKKDLDDIQTKLGTVLTKIFSTIRCFFYFKIEIGIRQ